MLVPLAVDLESEVARYGATRAITDRLKSSADWVGIDSLLALLDGLGPRRGGRGRCRPAGTVRRAGYRIESHTGEMGR